MRSLLQQIVVIGLIAIIGFFSYKPALNGPFVFDDTINIEDNRLVHLDDFSPPELAKLAKTLKKGRPLAVFSFALNYYFGKLDTFGYHIVNLLIHLAAAISLYFLVQVLLLDTPYQAQSFLIAASTSLFFVSHPIQTQSVSYIVQRMNSMAGLFYIVALLAYLRGHSVLGKARCIWWTVGGLSAICAFASKEIGATLPVVIFIIEYYIKPQKSTKSNRHWFLWVGGLAVTVLLTLVYSHFDLSKLMAGYKIRSFTLGQRLLTQPRVLVHYLGLLFLPLPNRLNLDYDFPTSFSLINPPTTILCIMLLLAIIVFSVYLYKKEPLMSFCIWWFFINLAIESSFIPLEMVFEHRLYLPSVGFFLLLSLLLAKIWQRFDIKEVTALLLILPIIGLLSLGTYQRNFVWADKVVLWEDVVSKSPGKARPHLTLGAAYADKKRYKDALEEYRLSVKIRPDYAKAHYNIGLAQERNGKRLEAIRAYQRALKIKPNYGEAHNNLGTIYLEQGRYDEAEKHLRESLRLKPEFVEIRGNLAAIYLKQGEIEKARKEFLLLLELKPNMGEAHYNLATIYIKEKNYLKARQHLLQALRLRPKRLPVSAIQNLLKQVQQKIEAG